ncbi:MAG TPA: hypothetical protein DD636_02175 [Anaerolineaceae bacterium]|nr:hypothetical protein [Anaerolineaceae bacterium]
MSLEQDTKEKYYDRIDIAQLAVSVLVFFLSLIWIGLVGLAAFGEVSMAYGDSLAIEPGMLINLMLTGLVFLAITLVSIVTTIQKITGNAKTINRSGGKVLFWATAGLVLVFGLAALACLASPEIKSIALAILAVLGIAIPVFMLLRVGARYQKSPNPKRDSGILTFSIGISTPFILLMEVLVIIFLLIVFVSGLYGKPEFMDLFNNILNNPAALQNDPTSLFSEFENIINLPDLMGWLLLVVAGIMPLVEELFKTLGVWLLKVRNPNPAESFRIGLLSGGGFALFEGLLSVNSLQLNSLGFAEWAGLILGRFGGSLLHILAGGIVGLAIGKLWQDRKLISLLLSYLAAWLLHAAWNALAIFGGINPLISEANVLAVWSYIGLVLLIFGMLLAFFGLIRKAQIASAFPLYPTRLEG